MSHRALEPKVVIDGLPDKLVAGQRYDLVVHWNHPEVTLALQLELSTPDGSHPTVEITPLAERPAESRCDQAADGTSAVYTYDVDARRIVGVSDCRDWDLTDNTTCEVAAGDYRVVSEHTDYNGAGAYLVMPFHKGTDPATLMQAETSTFHDLSIELR